MPERGIALCLFAAALQGVGDCLQKQGIAQELPPLSPFAIARRLPWVCGALLRSSRWLLGIGCAVASVLVIAQLIAEHSLSYAIPLVNLAAVFSLLFGVSLAGESLGAREWIGGIAALAGVWLAGSGRIPVSPPPLATDLPWLLTGAALAAAGALVLLVAGGRRRRFREVAYALAAGLLGGTNSAVFKLLVDRVAHGSQSFSVADPSALFAVASQPLALGVVATELAGQVCLSAGYSCGRVSVVVPLRMATSVALSLVLGAGLLGETPTRAHLGCVALIVCGGSLVASGGRAAVVAGHGVATSRSVARRRS